MSEQDAFDRTSALLHEAMLDDAHWLPTAALIDDACGTKGNMLTFAEGNAQDDVEIFHVRFCSHGEQNRELERENFTKDLSIHGIITLIGNFPDNELAYIPDLYTDQERRTSPEYNEVLPVGGCQNGLNVRLEGPRGSRIVWAICDPIATYGAERRRRGHED